LSFYFEGRFKSSQTGGSAPLLCRGRHNSTTAAHYYQSTNFSNGPRIQPRSYFYFNITGISQSQTGSTAGTYLAAT